MVAIKSSVGRNGVNRADDVIAIQKLLNRFIGPGRLLGDPLVTDGVAGDLTKNAIGSFQRVYLGFNSPDKRVDPNGQTLAKLNGPTTAAKLNPTLSPQVEGAVTMLRGSAVNAVRFQMGSFSIQPSHFRRVADVMEAGRVDVVQLSGMGDGALYTHANGGRLGGTLTVGFERPRTSYQKSVLLHEATHAVCDDWGRMMPTQTAEALAHLAQGIYYYELVKRHFSIVNGWTSDVLTTCVNIAIRMKGDGRRVVTSAEETELRGRVALLPTTKSNTAFYYDGL